MSGLSPREAVVNFARPIQAALHCVTQAKLITPAPIVDTHQTITFQHGEPVELRRHGNQTRLFLQVALYYRIIAAPDQTGAHLSLRVASDGYIYSIYDNQHRELLSYHWQANPSSGTRAYPHLHVGSRVIDTTNPIFGKRFSALHIPTGHITVGEVVRFLIEEMQVIPLHRDWLRIITENLEAHRQFGSWP